jgi:hypothetical protein
MRQGVAGVAPSAWEAFEGRGAWLYEQDAPQEEIRRRIGQYVRRWMRWVLTGVRAEVGTPWDCGRSLVVDGVPPCAPFPRWRRLCVVTFPWARGVYGFPSMGV